MRVKFRSSLCQGWGSDCTLERHWRVHPDARVAVGAAGLSATGSPARDHEHGTVGGVGQYSNELHLRVFNAFWPGQSHEVTPYGFKMAALPVRAWHRPRAQSAPQPGGALGDPMSSLTRNQNEV